ncbi:amidase [Klebsiella quasipneumoniae]|uniref:Amidase n=1 Tax=Klebsiella pneumoniae TaxID=573 RepID=A0A9J6S678_KLEPN|nr:MULTISPECIES: amidase family protein [Klebsiella]MRL38817.1 amidase [Klebsiella pneumoniae]HCT5784546.1 amidase [Klebsiella variicola]MCE0161646.1 amidase [Klebsiella variicola subsp. variicola]VGG57387.1 amidase [Klebsiella quasipneumoniae]HBX6198995.1 amidase [Klebsiella pneumoniae]
MGGTDSACSSLAQRIEWQFSALQASCENAAAFAILNTRREEALREAQAWDTLAAYSAPKLALSIAVKACIDVKGWITSAASQVLADAPPAAVDAPLVAALRQLGAVVTMQTNMTEFAYGALGVNPHFGTPRTPLDSSGQRVAGGSTSGGAVAVALGLADLALGTDTSGSVRIPAAYCGVSGFKPSKGRYPETGIINLSTTFDVPGLLARDVRLLQKVDAALTMQNIPRTPRQTSLAGRRFLVPAGFAWDCLDDQTAWHFRQALDRLARSGAEIVERAIPDIEIYGEIAVRGGVLAAESYRWHQSYLNTRADLYGLRVGPRIASGRSVKAWEYLQSLQELREKTIEFHQATKDFDAMLTPTVPVAPPLLAALEEDEAYYRTNRLVFRLAEVANRIDAPSISLPISEQQPFGLMLTGRCGQDSHLLQLSIAVQDILHPNGNAS